MNFTADLKGLAQFEQRMKALATTEATKAGQAAIRAGAVILKNAAVKEAPVSAIAEGTMQNRRRKSGKVVQDAHEKIINWIKVKKTKAPDINTVQTTVTVLKAYQANFVEFGSIHNAPNPFMRRAFDGAQQPIIDAVAKVLNRQLVKRGA